MVATTMVMEAMEDSREATDTEDRAMVHSSMVDRVDTEQHTISTVASMEAVMEVLGMASPEDTEDKVTKVTRRTDTNQRLVSSYKGWNKLFR